MLYMSAGGRQLVYDWPVALIYLIEHLEAMRWDAIAE